MGAEANTVASLLSKLKVDEPWIPPVPWESIRSEGGGRAHCSLSSPSPPVFYDISSLSESSLVRLAMYALQGAESAVNAIYQISASFSSESADRTFHQNSSLWARSSSTHSLGNLLKSIGQLGCIVYLLQKFILHFSHLNSDGDSESEKITEDSKRGKKQPDDRPGVINQAFAVAVKKILESYISALNTLYASIGLRRVLKNNDLGCLTNVGNSEITVMEVYLHTKGLRTQIEALGFVCQICDIAISFLGSSLDDLNVTAELAFIKFPRGAALLTFLYMQLKVVDPLHSSLLKFLFLQSFEPYYRFVRSWIYEGRMSDPYEEFVMEYVDHMPAAGISVEFSLSTVRVRERVTLPCFLEDFCSPLLRVGQQLQVLVKLLELCFNVGGCRNAIEEILPFFDNPFFASPLTFQKEAIEIIVLARNNYYKKMLEKVDYMFTKVELRSPQASPYAIQHLYAPNHGKNWKRAQHILDDGMVPVVRNDTDNTLPDNIVTNDACSTIDEFSDEEDMMVSSDSSSSNCFEEQNDAEQMPDDNMHFQPSYLSSLSISCSAESSVKTLSKKDLSYSEVDTGSNICKQTQQPFQVMDAYHCAHHEGTDEFANTLGLQFGGNTLSLNAHTECSSHEYDLGPQPVHSVNIGFGNDTWFNMSTSGLDAGNRNSGDLSTSTFRFSDTLFSKCSSSQITNNQRDQSEINCVLSSSFNMQSCNAARGLKFLSMNPSLSKACWLNSDKKRVEKSTNYRDAFSYFDFTSVRDPRKVCEEKLGSSPRGQLGFEYPILTDSVSDAKAVASDKHCRQSCNDGNSAQEVASDSKVYRGEETLFPNIVGGSKWESLLACFGSHSHSTVGRHNSSSMAFFDVPLDYVIKKCLLEEISLQYQYVSKVTLKILEEGFNLQEHLLTLRRFHFMEHADWADLFIFSLWHHKWHVVELDKRIMEIQGALELSIQRSSCEGDKNKDRLYAYVKGDTLMPLSVTASGIFSFDFIGLGYRVDWPVNIILTPGALKIYSDIFNFLIQVKLAIFSLSDIWRVLKGLMQETRKGCPLECPKLKLQHISAITKTRHQVNHFVSTLQQYVQSQLSHVSWCKFLKSLKHKVKDMMDFEAVHMEYLTESVDICFLSEETQSIASIIKSMLKCSVELRSCLIGCTLDFGSNGNDSSELPQIDISQVREIKKTFTKNMKDLFSIYLKSPKHGEYGLSRFWDLLNYNDYYGNDTGIQSHNIRCA